MDAVFEYIIHKTQSTNFKGDVVIEKLKVFILDNEYDTDAIMQDIDDKKQTESNLRNLCYQKNQNVIQHFRSYIKSHKCMFSVSLAHGISIYFNK